MPNNSKEKITRVADFIRDLVIEKQAAYGDSFGRSEIILKTLYPHGMSPDDYTNALAIIRITDKLFRLATNPYSDQEDPALDIAGYAILMAKDIREDGK